MPTSDCSKSTEQNILDSDGTLIVSHKTLTGGSAHHKPCMHVNFEKLPISDAAFLVKYWTHYHHTRVLNVAGPRANNDPEIYQATLEWLEDVFEEIV